MIFEIEDTHYFYNPSMIDLFKTGTKSSQKCLKIVDVPLLIEVAGRGGNSIRAPYTAAVYFYGLVAQSNAWALTIIIGEIWYHPPTTHLVGS